MHACEGELVCESINPKIPYFNAPIYLENKVGRLAGSARGFARGSSCGNLTVGCRQLLGKWTRY